MARVGINNLVEFAEAFYKAQASRDIKQDWQLISNIFDVHVSKGHMYVPKAFYPNIKKWFGKLDDHGAEDAVLRVENQVISKMFICRCSVLFLKPFFFRKEFCLTH